MSMILELGALSDENIRKVLAHPMLIWRVVEPDDPEIISHMMSLDPKGKTWSAKAVRELPPLELAEAERGRCDLDKAWHGIHYLLNGDAWGGEPPLNVLCGGGTPVGEVDVGYGPARVLTSTEVIALDAALRPVDEDWLRPRFNPKDMSKQEVYPDMWDRDPAEDDVLRYCLDYFATFKGFVNETAASGLGLVIRLY